MLLLILSHAGFASLLELKLVNHRCRTFARATLSSSSAWATARDLCPEQGRPKEMTNNEEATTLFRERLATGYLAALRADDVQTVEVLLHCGHVSAQKPVLSSADWQASVKQAFPLHFAHSAAMVVLLCSYEAQVDARRGDGSTALMEAACAGELEVVRALCERGANVQLCNGGRPSSIAIHQAENCDLRTQFLFSTRPSESLWRFPHDDGASASRRPTPDGAACVRVLLRFGAMLILV